MVLTYENLADASAERKAQHIAPHGPVAGQEVQRGGQLAGAAGGVHTEPLAGRGVDEPGAKEQVGAGQGGAEQVVGRHHLRARVGLEGGEDVVLGAVGEAVEQQVDAQQQEAPGRLAAVRGRAAAVLLATAAAVQREDGDAGGDGRHHQVLVQRVAAAEERDVQEHDGEQLAALGQDVRDVVDMREGRVAKGRRERVGEGDEQERREDAAVGDDRRRAPAAWRGEAGEEDAADASEQGLDRQEKDGELEALARRAVRRRCQLLLEVCPRQAWGGGGRGKD